MRNENYMCFLAGFAVATVLFVIMNITEPKVIEVNIPHAITAKLDVSDLRMDGLK
jgi:hypothetical protein